MASSTSAPQSSGDCRCACGDPGVRWVQLQDEPAAGGPWVLCTCTHCGPVREDGSRQCAIPVDPIVWGMTGGHFLCGDCWDSFELRRKRAAVANARAKRRRLEQGTGAASGAPGAASQGTGATSSTTGPEEEKKSQKRSFQPAVD